MSEDCRSAQVVWDVIYHFENTHKWLFDFFYYFIFFRFKLFSAFQAFFFFFDVLADVRFSEPQAFQSDAELHGHKENLVFMLAEIRSHI